MPPAILSTPKETTTVVGATDDVMLAGPVPGYRRFAEVVGDGNACNYAIVGAGLWEARLGKYRAASDSLERGTLLVSSTGGPVDFPPGVKKVFHEQPAHLLSELALLESLAQAPAAADLPYAELALTIAQIRALSSAPLDLVAAAGPNQIAMPREFHFRFTPGTPPAAFDFSNTFQYGLLALGQQNASFGSMGSNGLTAFAGMMSAPDWSLGYADMTNAANQPIQLTGVPIGGGAGTGWVRCYYQVIDLTPA